MEELNNDIMDGRCAVLFYVINARAESVSGRKNCRRHYLVGTGHKKLTADKTG